MTKLLTLALFTAFAPAIALACSACDSDMDTQASAQAKPTAKAHLLTAGETRVTIPVSGMHCDHCVSRVKASLAKLGGVKSVDVNLEKGQAVVAYEKGKVAPAKLAEAIEAAGFKPGAPRAN